jgi:predicted TIM-barrel fold metal-dependent hydrolase
MTMTEDITRDIARDLNLGVRAGFNTSQHLANAHKQAVERNYAAFPIVDVDAHHYENESWAEIIEYIENPVIRHLAESGVKRAGTGRSNALLHQNANNQSNAGRVRRYQTRNLEQKSDDDPHRDITLIRREMDAIGIDYQVVFPTPMLELGMHPDSDVEVAVSWAYTRWMMERVMPHEPRIKTMVYLPFNEPDAALRAVEQFAGKPGVVGFMVTSCRYRPVHHNAYMKLYRAIEETGLPLGFHAAFYPHERVMEGMNKFISVHAVGFVLYNLIHMTNWVINGLPERFPNLNVIWIESGLAWIPFLMQRLDNEYLMRTAEAPLLKARPSEYMKRMYYTTQPLETDNLEALQLTMKMINADSQLLFSSDYPHWDFNLPSTIYDLPFLREDQKRAILGGNALRLFNLPNPKA